MSTTPSAHPTFCCSQAGQAGTNQSTPHVLGLFQDPAARQRHRQLLPSENVENEKQNRTVREETRHTVIAITGPFLGSYYCFIPCYLIWPLPWLFKRAQAQARLAASIIISLTQSRKSKSSERANIRSTERTHHSRRKDPPSDSSSSSSKRGPASTAHPFLVPPDTICKTRIRRVRPPIVACFLSFPSQKGEQDHSRPSPTHCHKRSGYRNRNRFLLAPFHSSEPSAAARCCPALRTAGSSASLDLAQAQTGIAKRAQGSLLVLGQPWPTQASTPLMIHYPTLHL